MKPCTRESVLLLERRQGAGGVLLCENLEEPGHCLWCSRLALPLPAAAGPPRHVPPVQQLQQVLPAQHLLQCVHQDNVIDIKIL